MHLFLAWILVIGFGGFYGTFEYFDDRSALYLRKLIIERSIGTGGLLNVWIFLWKERLLKTWKFRRSGKSVKTMGDLRDMGDLQFKEICWNWMFFGGFFKKNVAVLPGKF